MGGAVFCDIDGTLISGTVARLALETGRHNGFFPGWQKPAAFSIDQGTRVLPDGARRQAELYLLIKLFATRTSREVEKLAKELVPELEKRFKEVTITRLKEHQESGLPLVLVSAAPQEMIEHLAEKLGARAVGTVLQREQRKPENFSIRINGHICQGEHKVKRVREIMQDLGVTPEDSYAYGDTSTDIAFLQIFGHPCVVDPDTKLAGLALQRGWEILEGKYNAPRELPRSHLA